MPAPLREDILYARAEMAITLGSNREIRKLPDYLADDEVVEYMVSGKYAGGRGLIVLTNKKVLFLKDGWFKASSQDFPFYSISSIEWKTRIFFGVIQLFSDGSMATIENVGRKTGSKIVSEARKRIGRGRPGTPQTSSTF